ncbi:MAG: type VI secretion system baseplate subunit TssG [Psychrosphaera sp.]|nr:type VI secretion system baseplate subunit TssG [Psychrosphaera sp.]
MATTHWRTGHTVADLYSADDAVWSFHQLVRLLLPTQVKEDELLDQINRRFDFKASEAQDFPSGEIRRVKPVNPAKPFGDKNQITCNHYNIAGLGGPLPEPFVEMLRDDQVYGEGAMAAFVNIFNNRIQALRYLIKAATDNNLTSSRAAESKTGQFLLSLSGHLGAEQRALHQQSSDTLIGLAGELANTRMTLPTITRLLRITLDLALIKMNCLLGRWLTVESSDHTLLGNANHRLGTQAVLGKKFWDQQAAFELVLGPMPASRLQQLVPGGNDHNKLRHLVEWISDKRCDCKITLVCQQNSATVATLSKQKNQTNTLGYGAWLSGEQSTAKKVSFMLNLVH